MKKIPETQLELRDPGNYTITLLSAEGQFRLSEEEKDTDFHFGSTESL